MVGVGCYRLLARYEKWGRGEGMIAYRGARDVVEFMRVAINRQRKRAAIYKARKVMNL